MFYNYIATIWDVRICFYTLTAMKDREEINWEKINSVDNHSLDKLTHEELKALEEYERHQTEVRGSGIPSWISDMYSNTPIQKYTCVKCGREFTRPGDPGDEYCSLTCMQRDQI